MKAIEYISYIAIPLMVLFIISFSVKQKKETYNIFLNGAREGMNVILKIFPTMIGILVAINLFQVTGAMDIFIKIISPITKILRIPSEIVPLGVMRSISGGASIGLLSNTLDTYGADSLIGKMACTILGSSETTLYVIAMYTSAVGAKNTRGVLKIALLCDFVALCTAVWIWTL
ncbi:MAG: spore maturation protein [Clostridia bacterium]|nr:spore maturation protein [Clostridia bacterium]